MKSGLKKAFVEDHRRVTRGFVGLRAALEADDIARARTLADELDRIAGPHIEFEERCFYPALKAALGGQFVARLYHEHGSGKAVLSRLLDGTREDTLAPHERDRLRADIAGALEHAYSCGTLVSHIDRFEPDQQAELLEALERMRERGARWTRLRRHARDAAA